MSADKWTVVVVRLPAENRRALVERVEGERAGLGAEVIATWEEHGNRLSHGVSGVGRTEHNVSQRDTESPR